MTVGFLCYHAVCVNFVAIYVFLTNFCLNQVLRVDDFMGGWNIFVGKVLGETEAVNPFLILWGMFAF